MKVIIDTDIGSDIDDAMAIALALKSPELELLGITTVYGDSMLRAKLAKRLVTLGGQPQIPVYSGIDLPLLRKRSVWMAGHEGSEKQLGIEDYSVESQHAVDFIIESILNNPGEVTLIPIGPLTNIATAIIKEPKIIKKIKAINLMGGSTRLGSNRLQPNVWVEEHNIACDPEAADVIFNSGIDITMVGLDVTMQVEIGKKEEELLANSDDPVNQLLAQMLNEWIEFVKVTFNDDVTYMHDPLAVASVFRPDLLDVALLDIDVVYTQAERTGQTVGKINPESKTKVALEVQAEAFKALLFKRLLSN